MIHDGGVGKFGEPVLGCLGLSEDISCLEVAPVLE